MIDIKALHDRLAGAMADHGWPDPFYRNDDPGPPSNQAWIAWAKVEDEPIRNVVQFITDGSNPERPFYRIQILGCFRDTHIINVDGCLTFQQPLAYFGWFQTFDGDIRWMIDALKKFEAFIK